MDKPGLLDVAISDISSTMLLTLYAHALESQSRNAIINDPKAEEITSVLNRRMIDSPNRMYRELAGGKLNGKLQVFIAIRARKYDEYALDFLKQYPYGTIVNCGCGLDTRYWRIDNGKMLFFDLDLPEVITIKRKLCSETERYHMLASSVLDYGWITQLQNDSKGPFLFLAEGLLMYLKEDDVKSLILKLQSEFPGSELACEVVNESTIRGPLKRALDMKMQRQLHVGSGATFSFGIKDGHEIEGWAPGIRLLDEWSHFDSHERKLGFAALYGKIPWMRKVQWTVHYMLG